MHAIALVVGLLLAQVSPGAGPGGRPAHGGLGLPRYGTEVKMSDPTVKSAGGTVDRMIVKRYLRRDLSKYRYCFEKQLAIDPSLAGTLTVTFTILPDGKVTAVRVEGVHDEVENCVAGFVRRLQLPRVPETAEVRTKVVFKAVRTAPGRPGRGCGGLGCGTLG